MDVEIVCSLSLVDQPSHDVLAKYPVIKITDSHVGLTGAVIAWNEATQIATGEIFAMVGDDAIVRDDWLKIALKRLEQLGDGVVGLNDMSRTDGKRFSTHPIVTREYLIKHNGGCLCVPQYVHYFVDVELCEHATMLGKYAFCSEALIEHHWNGNQPNKDNVYSWAMKYFGQDERCYNKRKQAKFPNDYAPTLS